MKAVHSIQGIPARSTAAQHQSRQANKTKLFHWQLVTAVWTCPARLFSLALQVLHYDQNLRSRVVFKTQKTMHLHIASLFTEGLQKILRIEAESCDSILHIQRSCQVRHCTIIVLAQIWSCTFAIVMHAILGYTETRLSLEPCLLFQERLGLQQSSLNELRLVYNGKTLNSRKTLTDYGIQNQSTVQLAPRLR